MGHRSSCLGVGSRRLEALFCVLRIIVGVNEVMQHTWMIWMARVNVLEELGGLTAELLKSRESPPEWHPDQTIRRQLCFVIWIFVVGCRHRIPIALVALFSGPAPTFL